MGEPAAPEGLSDTISAVRQTIAERLPQLAGSAAKGLVPLALGLGLMSVHRAPGDKCPTCPMPQTTQQHGQKQVGILTGFTLPVPTQREVEINS